MSENEELNKNNSQDKKKNNNKRKKKQIKKIIITIVLLACLGVGGFFAYKFFSNKNEKAEKATIAYTQLIEDIDAGKS